MNFDVELERISNEWASVSFENLYQRALDAAGGVSFSSLRVSAGPRMFLVVCFADPDLIDSMVVDPSMQYRQSTDWKNLFISDAVVDAFRTGNVEGFVRLDNTGRKSALALIAATPDSITKLGQLITLPA